MAPLTRPQALPVTPALPLFEGNAPGDGSWEALRTLPLSFRRGNGVTPPPSDADTSVGGSAIAAIAELKALFPGPDRRRYHYAGRKGAQVNLRLTTGDAARFSALAGELGYDFSGFTRRSLSIAESLVRAYRLVPAWEQAAATHGRGSLQARAIEAAFHDVMADLLPAAPWARNETGRLGAADLQDQTA